jgi:hypothetical protein
MVGIACDIGLRAVFDFAGRVGEAIPDGLAFDIDVPGSFDLVCGGGNAPVEVLRKGNGGGATRSAGKWRRECGGGQRSKKLAAGDQGRLDKIEGSRAVNKNVHLQQINYA